MARQARAAVAAEGLAFEESLSLEEIANRLRRRGKMAGESGLNLALRHLNLPRDGERSTRLPPASILE